MLLLLSSLEGTDKRLHDNNTRHIITTLFGRIGGPGRGRAARNALDSQLSLWFGVLIVCSAERHPHGIVCNGG